MKQREKLGSRLLLIAGLLLVAMVSNSCRVDVDDVGVSLAADSGVAEGGAADSGSVRSEVAPGVDGAPLPAVGPIPGSSHWHAAYVVRVCDDVLAPFDSGDDPLGIHSHADGVMHIHPFFEESGYEAATLGLFGDAMGFVLSQGELTLPGGGTWRDGDLCGDRPGRVFVDRWQDSSPESTVERIFADPESIRFVGDGELYQIAFAPPDSPPVVPPSAAFLGELSNLNPVTVTPWVAPDPTSGLADVSVWPVAQVSAQPCASDEVAERVSSGTPACFKPASDGLAGPAAIHSARAVLFNRQPAVEVRMTADLRQLIRDHFAAADRPLTLAFEIGEHVVTAPVIAALPVSDERLVIAGGFTQETARELANIFSN